MCDARPGWRCSEYARKTMEVAINRLQKLNFELEQYERKYADSLTTETPNGRDLIRQEKHRKLVEEIEKNETAYHHAEFEYYSSPAGQTALEAEIRSAETLGDTATANELKQKLAATKDYRKTQREQLRTLQKIEETEGVDAAAAAGWQMYEEAAEQEMEANIGLVEAEQQLQIANQGQAEYQEAYEKYLAANGVIDSMSPEQQKRVKQYKFFLTLGVLAASAVVSFSLAKSAASGQRSSLLHYGRTMAMRQITTHGQRAVTTAVSTVLSSRPQALEKKRQMAHEAAVAHAEAAKEKIYLAAQQAQAVKDREEYKQREREADRLYRQEIQAEERKRRQEEREAEFQHYQRLSQLILPAEQMKEIRSRIPKPVRSRKSETPVPV